MLDISCSLVFYLPVKETVLNRCDDCDDPHYPRLFAGTVIAVMTDDPHDPRLFAGMVIAVMILMIHVCLQAR